MARLTLHTVAFLNIEKAAGRPKTGLQSLKSFRSMKAAADAVEPIWGLAMARKKLGTWPNQAEYAAFWGISERSAQREWAAFRKGFPDEESPERLARWLYSEISEKIDSKAAALTVEIKPADLQPA